MPRLNACFLFEIILGACLSLPVSATVVQFDFQSGGQPSGSIYIELFDAQGPIGVVPAQGTVDNFLNYIDDNYLNGGAGNRRYDDTLVHRSTGSVIQGGGFVYDAAQGEFSATSVTPVLVDDPIINEFDPTRSNLRGTIAMARVDDGDPETTDDVDSATSQWFINLNDNSDQLDFSNEGFTVFGQVLGNGMALVDAIGAQDVLNLGGVFGELPVVDAGAPVDGVNVITLARVLINPPASISVDLTALDIGLSGINNPPATGTVTLQNIGGQDLIISNIGGTDGLAGPFSFSAGGRDDSCLVGQSLASTETCTIAVEFLPTALGDFQGSFDIASTDANQPNLTISVRGTGLPEAPVLEVEPTALDFGNVGTGQPAQLTVTLRNMGGGWLEPRAPIFSGTRSLSFSSPDADNACSGARLTAGQSCEILVRLLSFSLGGLLDTTLGVVADTNTGVPSTVQVDLIANVTLLEPEIELPASITAPDIRFDAPSGAAVFRISNVGVGDLYVTSISIQGGDAELFTVSPINNCIDIRIPPDFFCDSQIIFNPAGSGTFNTVVSVQSNDPDNLLVDILLVATVSQDSDGVADVVEAASPNNGDGNLDGVLDALQDNVASLPDTNGRYVTFETDAGLTLNDVQAIPNPSPANVPTVSGGSLDFLQGFYSFVIGDVPTGGQATVTLYLPEGASANNYFKFGRFPGEPAGLVPEHWYEFLFDPASQTGAEFLPGKVVLHFVDGGRGDNDQVADGRITDPGGPASLSVGGASGGGGGGCSMQAITLADDDRFRLDFLALLAGLLILQLCRRVATVRE